jgi:ABC-type polysaccharide/polyol phosphate export permease
VSGALYPTTGMPAWLRSVARLNPVTYQVDLMRVALGQPGELGVVRSLLTLAATSLVIFGLAAWLFDPEHRFVRPTGSRLQAPGSGKIARQSSSRNP